MSSGLRHNFPPSNGATLHQLANDAAFVRALRDEVRGYVRSHHEALGSNAHSNRFANLIQTFELLLVRAVETKNMADWQALQDFGRQHASDLASMMGEETRRLVFAGVQAPQQSASAPSPPIPASSPQVRPAPQTGLLQTALQCARLRGLPTRSEYATLALACFGTMVALSFVSLVTFVPFLSNPEDSSTVLPILFASWILMVPIGVIAWVALGATIQRLRAVNKSPLFLAALLIPGCGVVALAVALYWCLALRSARDPI